MGWGVKEGVEIGEKKEREDGGRGYEGGRGGWKGTDPRKRG